MTINLQQTAIDPDNDPDLENREDLRAMLKDTQGNILKSHGRDNSHHIFIEFNSFPSQHVKNWVAAMLQQYVTSAWEQMDQSKAYKKHGDDRSFVNLCLSAPGYSALGDDVCMPSDTSFQTGAKQAVDGLNDPPISNWEHGFQERIDALVIVANDSAQGLSETVAEIKASLLGIGTVVNEETGAAMRIDDSGKVTTDKSARVHEHFGFADGISQPLFFADDVEKSRLNSGGFDQWDPSAPLGLVLTKDENGGQFGYGSYFVYRKLKQDVYGFRSDEENLASWLFDTETPTLEQQELASAYIVGRFRDGTPVSEQAVDGHINEPNNFNYGHDVNGLKCPFHAHARKTNPRGDQEQQFDVSLTEERSRRIARRAISYGPLSLTPPAGEPVGLLFLCAQSSIRRQFEFMQSAWANNDDFLRPGTGIDAVIGQAPAGEITIPQKWSEKYGSHDANVLTYKFSQWVTMQGGEYFFTPSLSFLLPKDE